MLRYSEGVHEMPRELPVTQYSSLSGTGLEGQRAVQVLVWRWLPLPL